MEWCRQELQALSTGSLQLGFAPQKQQPTPRLLRRGVTAPPQFLDALLVEQTKHDPQWACATPSEPETPPGMRRVHRLSSELEVLAAEALQCSCDRNVPGAMDIFVQATLSLERLGALIHDIEQSGSTNGAGSSHCRENTFVELKKKKRPSTVGPTFRLLPWKTVQPCEAKGRGSTLLPKWFGFA